jgi:AraC-like DNA-binding protein
MSASTFRQHLRALTGLSPLRYQKQPRLQPPRQLMLAQNIDAGIARRLGIASWAILPGALN